MTGALVPVPVVGFAVAGEELLPQSLAAFLAAVEERRASAAEALATEAASRNRTHISRLPDIIMKPDMRPYNSYKPEAGSSIAVCH